MATVAGISLSGDKQLARKLQRVSKAVETKLARSALVVAARPIIQAAKSNIGPRRLSRKRERMFRASGKPVSHTGNLRKSIGWRIKAYRRNSVLVLVLGPRWPLGAHGHLVEFGTVQRYGPDGKSTGIGPALPFLRPAFDANIGKAKALMHGVMSLGLETAARA